MKVYISPSTQRANTYSYGGTNEAEQCRRIGLAARDALERCGFETRLGEETSEVADRIRESNDWGAWLHLAIHTNAGGGRGPVVFVYSLSEPRLRLAQPVYDALNAVVPEKSAYGVRAYPGLAELNSTSAIGVYVECEFHDEPQKARFIVENTGLLGETVCRGVCRGAGVEYKPPEGDATRAEAAAARLLASGWGDVLSAMADRL